MTNYLFYKVDITNIKTVFNLYTLKNKTKYDLKIRVNNKETPHDHPPHLPAL